MKTRHSFQDAGVRVVFDAYPAGLRADLLELRQLVFDTAHTTEGVGRLIETLKWGQPAYLPRKPKIGTTVRIDALETPEPRFAIFFHCQTTLVATFRDLYANELSFDGNRAIVFSQGARFPRGALSHCIALALTYHLVRRRG